MATNLSREFQKLQNNRHFFGVTYDQKDYVNKI